MPEETAQAATIETPSQVDNAAAEQSAAKTYDESYVKGLRTEAANARVKLREYEAAEDARKQSEMTEAQKLQARAEAAEKRARELEVQSIRTKAAIKAELPEDLHEFITAEDEAGAAAQAEKLATKLKASTGLPQAGGRQPANGGEQGKAQADKDTFDGLRGRIPALNGHTLKG